MIKSQNFSSHQVRDVDHFAAQPIEKLFPEGWFMVYMVVFYGGRYGIVRHSGQTEGHISHSECLAQLCVYTNNRNYV